MFQQGFEAIAAAIIACAVNCPLKGARVKGKEHKVTTSNLIGSCRNCEHNWLKPKQDYRN